MKVCACCKAEKPLDEFGKDKGRKDGRNLYCRACAKVKYAAIRDWYERNKARRAEQARALREADPARHQAYVTRWRQANREAHRKAVRAWAQANPELCRVRESKRRAAKLAAIPAWADFDRITEIYARARSVGMHVDHIVPLQSPLVCGLHVHDNLQLLPPAENTGKRNRYWPDMPGRIN